MTDVHNDILYLSKKKGFERVVGVLAANIYSGHLGGDQ